MAKSHWLIFCLLALYLAGCAYPRYRYDFSLIEPYEDDLKYEDEEISIELIPGIEYIWVSLYNKTDNNVYFIRDKAKYTDPWGKSHRILYGWGYASEMKEFLRDDLYLSSIRIGPNSSIAGNVWINIWPGPGADIGEGWTSIKDFEIEYPDHYLFPEYSFQGNGSELKGSTFCLKLPIDFGAYVRNYEFTFMITEVETLDLKKSDFSDK